MPRCNNPQQLSLLQSFDLQKVFDGANNLIDMLNDGKKEKDIYYAQACFTHNELFVFVAQNKSRDLLFNCLDAVGKIPNGFDACWRNLNNLKQEIK